MAAILRALGPWTGPDIDKEHACLAGLRPGDMIEGEMFHNTNDEAGTVVLVVSGTGPSERILECKVITTGMSLSQVTFRTLGFTELRMVARTMGLPM